MHLENTNFTPHIIAAIIAILSITSNPADITAQTNSVAPRIINGDNINTVKSLNIYIPPFYAYKELRMMRKKKRALIRTPPFQSFSEFYLL